MLAPKVNVPVPFLVNELMSLIGPIVLLVPVLLIVSALLPPVTPVVAEISPAEAVNTVFCVNVTLPPKVWLPVVVTLLPSEAAPEVEKVPPVTEMGAVLPKVKTPLLVTAKLPAVVVKPFSTLYVVPCKVADPAFTLPVNVVAPVAVLV